MDDCLTRIDSTIPLPDILARVSDAFRIGAVTRFATIPLGYQECNVDLTTSDGRYVVKIFSKDKSRKRIDDVIWGYAHFKHLGVPFPELIKTQTGDYVLEIHGSASPLYLCVFGYIDGKPLTQTPITDTDIQSLAGMLSTIHSAKKKIDSYHDTLGIAGAPQEFARKKSALLPEEARLVEPVIMKLRRIDLSLLPQSIIHGTIEKENILKDSTGQLHLLDLGCMDYNASVLDIATCIANITMYLEEQKRKYYTGLMLSTYQKTRPLTQEESATLPTLIRAQYTAYVIGMAYHMRLEHDMSKQTQTWLDRGLDGLRTYERVKHLA